MTARTSHILLILSAFLTGLVVFTGVFLYATGNFGGAGPGASAIGGPFKLVDQNGEPITDADIKGRPFLVFFGYTHCPDVCPTTLVRRVRGYARAWQGCGSHRRLVHHGRSGARHPGGDERLSVELRSASARCDGRPCGNRCGRKGVSRLRQEGSTRQMATTVWITLRWSISWTSRAVSLRRSASSDSPRMPPRICGAICSVDPYLGQLAASF